MAPEITAKVQGKAGGFRFTHFERKEKEGGGDMITTFKFLKKIESIM